MKQGCPKCCFTGFSYGKIPCACTETKLPLSRQMAQALVMDLIEFGDIVYYDNKLLGECTGKERYEGKLVMITVAVPKFMGYGASPELTSEEVNVSPEDSKVRFIKGRRP